MIHSRIPGRPAWGFVLKDNTMTIRGTDNCNRYLRVITAIREHLQDISEKLDRLPRVTPADGLQEPSVETVSYSHIYDLDHAASQLDTVAATIDMIFPKGEDE